jgi:6-pyruvoyltetrahydropterin/6-carboxytetrahydropterin synthase
MKINLPTLRPAANGKRPVSPPVAAPLPAGGPVGAAPATVPDDFWQVDEDEVFQPTDDTFYQMSVDVFFNARHFVSFQGEPGPEHPHSYRLQATCRTQGLVRDDHMVMGFQFLRQAMTRVVHAYNNQLLNRLPPFKHLQPTTEVLAVIIFQQLDRLLADLGVVLMTITVWESPTESITYGRNRQAPA